MTKEQIIEQCIQIANQTNRNDEYMEKSIGSLVNLVLLYKLSETTMTIKKTQESVTNQIKARCTQILKETDDKVHLHSLIEELEFDLSDYFGVVYGEKDHS